MKKVLALTLCAGLASAVASTSAHATAYLDNLGIWGTATYTRPSNNGLSIGEMITRFPVLSDISPYDRSLFLSPDFDWDYAVGVSYRFPCTCTRLFAEYDNFNASDARVVSGLYRYPLGPTLIGDNGSTRIGITNSANANVMETAHEWRIGLRHFVPFGARFSVDFSGFIEYNRVNMSVHEWWNQYVLTNEYKAYFESNSKFYGWGPGVGFKLIGVPFACYPTLNVFAGIMTTLFYATNSFDMYENLTYQTGTTPPTELSSIYNYHPENSHSILSKVDIKFGIDYVRKVCLLTGQHQAGITVGVRYMNIFNAFKNGNIAQNAVISGNLDIQRSMIPLLGVPNDWGRVGPYIQFRLGGCNA